MLVWYPISQMAVPGSPGGADQETMLQACDLTDGMQELYVEDAGGHDYGDSICSQEVASDAQQAEQQQASASAAAQAQQEQANLSHDDQVLDSDGSTLDNDLGTWSTDMTTANGQSVYDDESGLSNDISSVQSAMSAVNSDLAQLGGTQGGTTYANDLAAAQTAVPKGMAAVGADDSSKIQGR